MIKLQDITLEYSRTKEFSHLIQELLKENYVNFDIVNAVTGKSIRLTGVGFKPHRIIPKGKTVEYNQKSKKFFINGKMIK
jgi:hypothetical protein